MRGALDTSTDLVPFGKFNGSLYIFDRLDLGDVDRNEPLVAGKCCIAIDAAVAITAFPGYKGFG
jgi:hypothetical protein